MKKIPDIDSCIILVDFSLHLNFYLFYTIFKNTLVRINFKQKQHQYLIMLTPFPIYCLFNININKEPSISEISEHQLVQRYPIRADSTNKSHFWHKLILDRSLYLVMDPPPPPKNKRKGGCSHSRMVRSSSPNPLLLLRHSIQGHKFLGLRTCCMFRNRIVDGEKTSIMTPVG